MALIVEDGSGLPDAEAYLSVADADTYWAVHGNPASWSGAAAGVKETALRHSTEFIDERYGQMFAGRRAKVTQRLRWPRFGVADLDGIAIESTSLPRRLKDACAELAGAAITDGALFITTAQTSGDVTAESVAVGSISVSTSYSGGVQTSESKGYNKARRLLQDFFDLRLGRA